MSCEGKELNEMSQGELENAMFDHMGYRWPQVFPKDSTWSNDFSRNMDLGSFYLHRFGMDEWHLLEGKFTSIYVERLKEINNE